MLYEETEKKEIERVYAVFADYIRESPYLEWLWSDKLGYLLLKISTKKPQKSARSTFMLLTLRRVGLFFPGKDFFTNGLVFRQPFKEGVPAPLYLGQFQRIGGLFSVVVAGHL